MRELWLCRNTVIEMLKERGYSVNQPAFTYDEFVNHFPLALSNPGCMNFTAETENLPQTAIHFTNEEKLSKASFDKILQEYSVHGLQNIILITAAKLNPSCKALIKASKIMIEHFLVEELQFNVTKHVLVPKHRILSEEEADALVKRLMTDKGSLPTILTTDPVCRFIGGRPGNVVEIERKSETVGKSLYYRTVRKGD